MLKIRYKIENNRIKLIEYINPTCGHIQSLPMIVYEGPHFCQDYSCMANAIKIGLLKKLVNRVKYFKLGELC